MGVLEGVVLLLFIHSTKSVLDTQFIHSSSFLLYSRAKSPVLPPSVGRTDLMACFLSE